MKEKINLQECLVLIGSMFIIEAAVYYVMIPRKFIFGGVSGLVIILTNFLPFSVSLMTLVINGFLVILGLLLLGKEFGIKTIIASFLNPMYLKIFEMITPNPQSPTGDIALDMMILVLVLSLGQAMLFHINASSGGMDIIAALMNKYFHLKIGTSLAILGYVIVGMSFFVYDSKVLVTSVLTTYLNGVILDNFSDGFRTCKKVCVLSEQNEAIKDYIIHDLYRGVTIYKTEGGYNGVEKQEIVTIVDKHELGKLLQFIHQKDKLAFITVTNISDVRGHWIRKHNF